MIPLIFFPIFALSFQQENFKLYNISPFLFSLSNLSIKAINHSLNSTSLFNIYSNHPIFLGIHHQSPINFNIRSIHFNRITSPLLHGTFSRVELNSLQIDKIQISSDDFNTRCTDLININGSDCFPVFFGCNIMIKNCKIENFFPIVDNTVSTTRSSVIQSYDANISIDHSSFHYCNSNTSPILFSALSDINFLFSNFSFNSAESEGVFSMTRSTGTARSCFFGNNEAHENGLCSISESVFNFYSNAVVHNRADINSVLFLVLSNSTLNHNYFVANRIQGIYYGIVSIYDDLKTSTNVSFIRCIFSLNKEIDDESEKLGSNSQSVYSIFYRGDDSFVIDHCVFDTDFKKSIIIFDGGSLINISSTFSQSIQTPYDIFDNISFINSKGFKMDFGSPQSTLFSMFILTCFLLLITIVVYCLNRISGGFF